MFILRCLASIFLAYIIQNGLDYVIPLDWTRHTVIAMGGLGFLVWREFNKVIWNV